jgi:hypothetical protein
MRTDLVTNALAMALEQRRPDDGVVFHADYAEQAVPK